MEKIFKYQDFTTIEEVISSGAHITKSSRQKLGSDEEDYYFPIKIIYRSKIRGYYNRNTYLNRITDPDIDSLIENEAKSGKYFLENLILTEAYEKYYKYLLSQSEYLKRKIVLDITEKVILIYYLQKTSLFPKKTKTQTKELYYKFVGSIIDEPPKTISDKFEILSKIHQLLSTIKGISLNTIQNKEIFKLKKKAEQRIKQLKKVADVLKLIDDVEDALTLINGDIELLDNFLA